MTVDFAKEYLLDDCADCPENKNGECMTQSHCFEVKRMAIQALEQTRWIPVSERLPEEGEDVLVWYRYWRYGEYNDWYYTYGIGYQYTDNWSVINGGTRTTVYAWMPLPQPYKGESEDTK